MLAIRGKEALWVMCIKLCGDLQPYSLFIYWWKTQTSTSSPKACSPSRDGLHRNIICESNAKAFREDRYHATVIESDEHFLRCLVYIDMNMVRAGVVKHPAEWVHGGYREIQQPPRRYRIIDTPVLMDLGGFNDIATMQQQLRQWWIEELTINNSVRDKT